MKLHFFVLTVFLFCGLDIMSQCEDRYQNPVFEDIVVDTITYSDVTGFKMDVYTAADDDYTGLKPLIIFAHGGAFYLGSKNTPSMTRLGNEFAKRGYVAASIQYTLTENFVNLADSLHIVEIVMRAIGDGKAAIRWFRKNATENGNQFNVDTSQLFVGGNSAGAVLMTNLVYIDEADILPAYMDSIILANGGLDGPAGNYGYSSKVNGVLNLAGAVYNRSILSNNTSPPIFSIQGDKDGIVPFDCNKVFWENSGDLPLLEMCGSSIIHEEANKIGLYSELVVLEEDGHTPWDFDTLKMSNLVERSSNFVYNLLDCNVSYIAESYSNITIKAQPNPAKDYTTVDFRGFGTFFDIYVMDLSGKIIFKDKSISSYYSLNRNNLKDGVYLLLAKNEEYSITSKIIFN